MTNTRGEQRGGQGRMPTGQGGSLEAPAAWAEAPAWCGRCGTRHAGS